MIPIPSPHLFLLGFLLSVIIPFAHGESSTCLTVYKNGGAPAVFQSPKCPRWKLSDYDPPPQTTVRCQNAMLQGRRSSQEDRTLCVLDVRIPFPGAIGIKEVVVAIVAVFDGHNGAEASEMASKLLVEYFVLHTYFLLDATYSVISKTSTGTLPHKRDRDRVNLLHRWKEILGWHELHFERFQNTFSANFDDSFHLEILKEALLRAIHDIDAKFSEEASRNGLHSGSTATIVLVADDKIFPYVGSVAELRQWSAISNTGNGLAELRLWRRCCSLGMCFPFQRPTVPELKQHLDFAVVVVHVLARHNFIANIFKEELLLTFFFFFAIS